MAATDADRSLPDLLPQIHALFSDQLRVISYKWLSRNFSVSSNDAKRLLQEFVIKHGTDIQVIYSVSGWLKDSAQTYCVKLTSGPKLEEARQEFKDSCSVQVYSIQACIPKDTAVLWNPEFVQAEELFNQPFDEDNCLRDNRFCGVVNSFVKRATKGKNVSSLPPKPVNSVAAAALSKPSSASKEQSVTGRQQGLPEPSIPKKGTGSNTEKDHTSVLDESANAPVIKEPSIVVNANKNGKNGKTLPSNGGSLATMWGRASAKPKTPATTNSTNLPSIPVTADAQICAKEEANAESSDDEQGVHYKRSSSGSNNRKRRAVFDLSDDDEEDNVVAIASPEPPKQCVANPVTEAAQDSKPEQKELESKQEMASDLKGFTKGPESDFTSECKTKSDNTVNHSGITLKEKSNDPPVDDNKQDHAAKASSTSPKKRKVLKTRIDDRGREVTEVVWEGESSAGDQAEKNVTSTDATSRPTIPSKPQPATNPDRNNASSKTAGSKKPAKAAPKQGKNMLSFFKKI